MAAAIKARSAQHTAAIARATSHESAKRGPKARPNAPPFPAMAWLFRLVELRAQRVVVRRVAFFEPLPRDLERGGEILLAALAFELDDLHAVGLELLVLGLGDLRLFLERDLLVFEPGLDEIGLRIRRQRLELVGVDDEQQVGLHELRIDAELRELVPAEVAQVADHPARALDRAAL